MLFKTWQLILAKQQCSPAVLQRSRLLFQAHVPALRVEGAGTAWGGGGGSSFPKRGSFADYRLGCIVSRAGSIVTRAVMDKE